jgi:hypothetical protein
MTQGEKHEAILNSRGKIAEAWSRAPVGWDTWVSVDRYGEVHISYQTTSTSPHPDNEDFVMSLSYIYEILDECDDGEGYCHPDDLWDDIRLMAQEAIFGERDPL